VQSISVITSKNNGTGKVNAKYLTGKGIKNGE
jgi:hypothetical protein